MMMNTATILEVMRKANDLIHDFRNNPESITNNARQVEPVISALRVAIYELEEKLKGGLSL